MAWEQLAINKPHLAYTILGGFTSIFMLCSLFIKEKLYIGEATVATICGIIFGPVGANMFVPQTWGNVDQITLECARIVLVVQCFAVGVELPKKYMERHWKSVIVLLVPVMTYGWLITSLFIWWLIPSLTWLESLTCAACVTATDPVLASSVVGKGKFARRIPKHLRDLLSAESGCNDGMAFPFIFLALYIVQYRPATGEVFAHWICITILYECVFGAVYGVAMGYIGRHMIKFAERKNLIDRESFLVFYFVLALWCAGTGSMLGLDDLLVGFAAGVGFSNDGWFAQKTEDSHVSNVLDLLLNLAFFVYFGAIIPWSSYQRPEWGITVWRLVVIAILVILFRRIPIMLAMKPLIPDVKTWREALFAGHFGPIGVGAVFVAIMARAELEHENPKPLADLPSAGSEHYLVIQLIWPITSFLIIASIIVHGSSIAVFTLGKHINTMRITMSYTTANEEPNWLQRLPRLTPRTSMSIRKPDLDESSDEKSGYDFPPGTLPPPGGIPGGFLARRTERDESPLTSRPASIRTKRRRHGSGGPIHDSAITPRRVFDEVASPDTAGKTEPEEEDGVERQAARDRFEEGREAQRQEESEEPRENLEGYVEGPNVIVENEEGDVIGKTKSPEPPEKVAQEHDFRHHPVQTAMHELDKHDSPPEVTDERSALAAATVETQAGAKSERSRRPAYAFRLDENIIVEDEDGEVIRQYKIPKERRRHGGGESSARPSVGWTQWRSKLGGMGFRKQAQQDEAADDDDDSDAKTIYSMKTGDQPAEKKGVNWRMHDEKGRRLSKKEFLHELQKMDPHARAFADSTSASEEDINQQLRKTLRNQGGGEKGLPEKPKPQHPLAQSSAMSSLTAAGSESPPDSPAAVPAEASRASNAPKVGDERDEETAAERKRREAALGMRENEESDSEEEGEGRLEQIEAKRAARTPGIRFADTVGPSQSRVDTLGRDPTSPSAISWGDVKGKGRE